MLWSQALPVGLTALHLSTCERLQGEGLSRLAHLRSLRLSGCPAVTEAAVQVLPPSPLAPRTLCPSSGAMQLHMASPAIFGLSTTVET